MFSFLRTKYQKELLIDCFLKSSTIDISKPTEPYQVDFYELIFITEGTGRFRLDDEVIAFKPGTIILLPPKKWRQWTQIDTVFDGIFLLFEEEYISSFFNDPLYLYRFHYFYNQSSPSFIQLENDQFAPLAIKLGEIQQEINTLKNDSTHLLRALLYYLLIRLNRIYESQHTLSGSFYQEPLVLKFRKLLEREIQSKQRVQEYAEMLKVSTTHLNKLLKKYFGKSCSEIIKQRLAIEVKKGLLFSDKTISELSHELGFQSSLISLDFAPRTWAIPPLRFVRKMIILS